MIIKKNTIYFNSIHNNYDVERNGDKSNTVRFVDRIEHGLIKGANLTYITIENVETHDTFTRILTDHRQYKGHGIKHGLVCWIFSW